MGTIKDAILRRVIAHYIEKLEGKMKPLPKAAGIIGFLGTLASGIAGVAGVLPPKYAAIATSLGGLLTLVSHSLTGNGVYTPPQT